MASGRNGTRVRRTDDKDEIDNLILGLVSDAEEFSDNELSFQRAETWRFYNGEVNTPSRPGRSSVVKTEVRDTVELLMPSIITEFVSADHIVEFKVGRQQQGNLSPEEASTVTQEINDIFWNDNGGWLLLHDSVKETLVARSAVLKVYEETIEEYDEEPLDPFDDMGEEIARLGGAEIIEPENTGDSGDPLYDEGVKIARFPRTRKKIIIEAVPSEELLIDRRCRDSGDGAVIIGQRSIVRLGDLVQMGFPKDMVLEFGEAVEDEPTQEESARTGYNTLKNQSSTQKNEDQWALREVTLKEVFPLLDVEGNGELKRYQCFVVNDKVLRRTEKTMQPYVVFSAIRIPHTAIGRSPGEHTREFQEEGTQVLRQAHDNLLWANNPGLAVIRNAANPYQVENWGFGQIIDTKMPNAVTPITIPFVGDKAIMMLEYMEKQREARTGGYRDAMGLNPEKLRGQTATAAEGAMSQATRQIGMYARVVAETGFVQLFKKVYHLRYGKPCPLNMQVNVGLGNGTVQEKMMILSGVLAKQEQVLGTIGLKNPIVTPAQYAYTLQELVKLAPYYDPNKMFNSPEKVMQEMQAQAQQPPPPDPKMIEAQAKAQAQQQKSQIEMQKAQQDAMLKQQELKAKVQAIQAKLQADIQAGVYKSQAEVQLAQQKAAADIQLEREKAAAQIHLDEIELEAEMQLEAANVALQNKSGQGNIPKGKRGQQK